MSVVSDHERNGKCARVRKAGSNLRLVVTQLGPV